MSTKPFLTARLRLDVSPLDGWVDFLDNVDERVAFAGERVRNVIESPLLDELKTTPGAVKYPIMWTSEKQRRAFFATDGFGRGIPTQRSNKMVNAWVLDTSARKGRFTLKLTNTTGYSQFVVGKIDFRSRNAAIAPMQGFHRNTGWLPVVDTISFWFDVATEEYNTQIRELLNEAARATRRNR